MFAYNTKPTKISFEKQTVEYVYGNKTISIPLQYGSYLEIYSDNGIDIKDYKLMVVGENEYEAVGILYFTNAQKIFNSRIKPNKPGIL